MKSKPLYQTTARILLAGTLLFAPLKEAYSQTKDSILERLMEEGSKETVHKESYGTVNELISTVDDLIEYLEKEVNDIHNYHSRFNKIKGDVANKNYNRIESRVRLLAYDLEKEKPAVFADEILEELKSLSYTKLVRIEAKTKKVVDKQGYYEKVPAKYKTKTRLNPIKTIVGGALMYFTLGNKNLGSPLEEEKVKVKDSYEKWVEPTYKNITIPTHRKKVKINPYYGTQTIIQDNIPIR